MKELPILFRGDMVRAICEGRKTQTRRVCRNGKTDDGDQIWSIVDCPYGEPGDRLWVKETWNHAGFKAFYRADGPMHKDWKWKPSIFMPRWASRITLEIVSVRLQRVQKISPDDCVAEGISCRPDGTFDGTHSVYVGYCELWDSINAKRGYGWAKNPYVWAIEFKRIPKPL